MYVLCIIHAAAARRRRFSLYKGQMKICLLGRRHSLLNLLKGRPVFKSLEERTKRMAVMKQRVKGPARSRGRQCRAARQGARSAKPGMKAFWEGRLLQRQKPEAKGRSRKTSQVCMENLDASAGLKSAAGFRADALIEQATLLCDPRLERTGPAVCRLAMRR
jgi:hypothetical protein